MGLLILYEFALKILFSYITIMVPIVVSFRLKLCGSNFNEYKKY